MREDGERVDRLQQELEAAGLTVWRDTKEIAPGELWKARLRDAIGAGALAFLPCFSRHSERRTRSTMFAELVWAAEEYRQRNPAIPWIFPVLLDDCKMPHVDLGADRTLADLEWTRVTDEVALASLIAALLRLLPAVAPTSVEITDVRCSPGHAQAGTMLMLEVEALVEGGPAAAWLGATLTDPEGREYYDPLRDKAVRLTPGWNACQRHFRIPSRAPLGRFDLTVAFWHHRIGHRQLASVSCDSKLTVS